MAHTQETENDEDLITALRHPMRRRILRDMVLAEKPTSPMEMSKQIRHPLSNVSYHVRVLSDLETIRLVDMQPVRGSIQHYYEPGSALDIPWVRAVLKLPQLDNDDALGR